MSSLMMAQMGLSVAGGLTSWATASAQAKVDRRMQQYRNTINQMNAARQTNSVVTNELRTRDALAQSEALIQRTSIQDKGRAAVSAAAAGVKGNSVDLAIRELEGSSLKASYAQRRRTNMQLQEFAEQRKSIAIGAVTGEDMQIIPKPSIGALMLGTGANLLSIYESHQPEGSRLIK